MSKSSQGSKRSPQKRGGSRGNARKSPPRKKPAKNNPNSNMASIFIVSLLFVAAIGVLVWFSRPNENEPHLEIPSDIEYMDVIFHFPSDDGWGEETRQIEPGTNNEIISRVLGGLIEGPKRADLQRSIPESLTIQEFDYNQATSEVKLMFDAGFHNISPRERLTLTSSLVYTLTELPFVAHVVFYAGGEPVLDGEGNPFGSRDRDNTSIKTQEPPPPPITITLYFPDEQMMGLVAETREVAYNPLVGSLETLIVEALIAGPRTLGLSPSFPPDTAINSVTGGSIEGGLVIVDFAEGFLAALATGGSLAEEMFIYSLVNSLTQIPENHHVQIFIDSLPITYDDPHDLHLDLTRPIERDESLILR